MSILKHSNSWWTKPKGLYFSRDFNGYVVKKYEGITLDTYIEYAKDINGKWIPINCFHVNK